MLVNELRTIVPNNQVGNRNRTTMVTKGKLQPTFWNRNKIWLPARRCSPKSSVANPKALNPKPNDLNP